MLDERKRELCKIFGLNYWETDSDDLQWAILDELAEARAERETLTKHVALIGRLLVACMSPPHGAGGIADELAEANTAVLEPKEY